MRVTANMIQTQILQSMSAAQEQFFITQRQISTTKEVSSSSDDPTRYDRSARFRTLRARSDQFLINIEDGMSWGTATTTSLSQIHDLLSKIQTDGLNARNDINAETRAITGSAIDSLLEELVSLGNSDFGGKKIFGGTITEGIAPFTFDGSAVTYNGNTSKINRKIGEDTKMPINVTGDEFLSAFAAVINLRDGLNADDDTAIDAALEEVAAAMTEVLTVTARAGSTQRRLELTRDNLQVAKINLESYISQAEDVDLAEAILRFNSQELGFRAALESSTRIQSITILDYLR